MAPKKVQGGTRDNAKGRKRARPEKGGGLVQEEEEEKEVTCAWCSQSDAEEACGCGVAIHASCGETGTAKMLMDTCRDVCFKCAEVPLT